MPKQITKIFLTLAALLLLPNFALGATQAYSENFDDQSLAVANPAWVIRRYGGAASFGEYSWITGRNGTGYAIGSGNIKPIWLEWNPNRAWPTGEIYMSFWLLYPNGVDTGNANYFKPMYWYFTHVNDDDKLECWMQGDSAGNASLNFVHYNDGAYVGGASTAVVIDANWHHYELWVNLSTSEYRFWYNRPAGDYTSEATATTPGTYMKIYRNLDDNVWGGTGNIVQVLNAGSMQNNMGTGAVGTIDRYIDDLEVWDGMPDEEPGDTTAPNTPSRLAVS